MVITQLRHRDGYTNCKNNNSLLLKIHDVKFDVRTLIYMNILFVVLSITSKS